MKHPQGLISHTLYSRVSSGVTCKVLAMSLGQETIFFCEITECGIVEYQILREKELWKYYHEENIQDLAFLLEAVLRRNSLMSRKQRLVSKIRGDDLSEFKKAAIKTSLKSHPGVIMTSHAADGHRALTDYLFAEMSKHGIREDVLSLNSSEGREQELIFRMEDNRERGEGSEFNI